MSYLILDTETTSKYPEEAECLQVAIIDHLGTVLLDTLVRPARAKSWLASQHIHGISPADVKHAPTLATLTPTIAALLSHRTVVIYNASYDTQVLHEAFAQAEGVDVQCAMRAYSCHEEVRSWNYRYDDWRYQSLHDAAAHVGHQWQGAAHNALADCYAARDVWAWLTDPAERTRLETAEIERRAAKELAWHVGDVFGKLWKAEAEAHAARNRAWERAHFPAMGVWERRSVLPNNLDAEMSADVFCIEPLGTTARTWNRYGKLLKLPRYFRTHDVVPAHLTSSDELYLLPGAKLPPPAGLLIYSYKAGDLPHQWLDAKPLYHKRSLRVGVHYVPHLPGYEPWPAGHYSRTTLQKQFKLKPAQIDAMKPAFLRVVKSGKYYENEYLLYPYTPTVDEKPS